MSSPPNATESLGGAVAGDLDARKRLMELVYEDLRAIAHARMVPERANHTLQPTALVHEAYVRLIDQDCCDLTSRSAFLGIAAREMRRILIDHARRKRAEKRGGNWNAVPLEDDMQVDWNNPCMLLAVDEALTKLAEGYPAQARVVELLYFGGLTQQEAADVIEVSRNRVKDEWRFARAWLNRELGDREED